MFKCRLVVGWRMDYITIGLYLAVLVNLWVTISLFKQLTDHINSLITELVEDLPEALGEAMGGSLEGMAGMADVNPIQMAIAQIIPNLFEKPAIEAKLVERGENGQFVKN
tara:strand:- start:23 stop:352 length:330 start_codon:yes stop_codon:yes gene_type:complete